MTANTSSIEQMSSSTGQSLASSFLTSIVVEKCQASCESVAVNLDEESSGHGVLNDFISACDEYTTAAARGSRHRTRYAAWCAERCSETASLCDDLGDSSSRRCARWCRLLLEELNREIHWKDVKKVMNTEINWSGVQSVMNKEVKLPWSG